MAKRQTLLKRFETIKAVDALRGSSVNRKLSLDEATAIVSEAIGRDDISRYVVRSIAADAGVDLRSPRKLSCNYGGTRVTQVLASAIANLYLRLGEDVPEQLRRIVDKKRVDETDKCAPTSPPTST